MGDLIYPPSGTYPIGLDCPACTPALYPSGGWPSVLYAKFSGMIHCWGSPYAPNGHFFELYQTDPPCNFHTHEQYNHEHYYVRLDLSIAQLWLQLPDLWPGDVFFGPAAPCSLSFPTNLCTCPANAARLGSAFVTPSPTPLPSYLCGQCHLLPWQGTRSEEHDVAMDHTLVRLANKADKSCIYVYFDDEDFPE